MICTIGPNQNTDFPYSQPFRSYGPIWVPALFLSFHIEGLGFEPRTLGFEAQVATTLATEARLVNRFDTHTYFTPKDLPWYLTPEAP